MEDFQFYPTPPELASYAWSLFKDKDFMRVLEPEAGSGSLIKAMPRFGDFGRYGTKMPVDCFELDIEQHPRLREIGCKVLGLDFLQFEKGSQYSHIIMNPPFDKGVHHLLHAWGILWHGEIVCILNAETIRNPFSKERQLLAKLIEDHGSVDFRQEAFSNAVRRTDVEVAVVHLVKKANSSELLGNILADLKIDRSMDVESEAYDVGERQDLALPNSTIENMVLAFDAAWIAVKDQVRAEARASYYKGLLGNTLAQQRGEASKDKDRSAEWVRRELQERYVELKDRAWANVLQSTDIRHRLSSKVAAELENRFEEIKALDFTASNVRSFLLGLVENQSALQLDMACEVFDEITRYHTDNRVHYRGWKSNDKHRTCGFRIKKTRFILPNFNKSFGRGISIDAERKLADFDKIFAMLDGDPHAQHYGLVDLFKHEYDRLEAGERVSCEFFDVRYYPGAGTVHFFPGKREHIDRLNLIVGRQRQWLPPENERVNDAFWLQYEKAEQFDKQVRERAEKHEVRARIWGGPLNRMNGRDDDDGTQQARAIIDEVLAEVQQEHGIDIDVRLEDDAADVPALEHVPTTDSLEQSDLFAA